MSFDRDLFAKEVGSCFVLKGADATVDLELTEVSELKERPHQSSFALVFLAPKSLVVEQGLYDVQHEQLGEMQIFLVPIGVIDERMKLEAVFNFLRED